MGYTKMRGENLCIHYKNKQKDTSAYSLITVVTGKTCCGNLFRNDIIIT